MVLIKDMLGLLDDNGIEYDFRGDEMTSVEGFSSLRNYKENTLTWIKNQSYFPEKPLDYKAIITSNEDCFANMNNRIGVKDPKRAFFLIVEGLLSVEHKEEIEMYNTFISKNVKLGENVKIGAFCVINGDITIGDNTVIHNHVNIYNKVTIGKDCNICSGANIGGNGYGYIKDDEGNIHMIDHYGGVSIGDRVHIGTNTLIERGVIDDTVIGDGSKIDCMCGIGHNSVFGKDVSIVGGSQVYGSVTIEDGAYLATSIIRENLTIGADATVGVGALVLKDVAPGDVVVGSPAKPLKK